MNKLEAIANKLSAGAARAIIATGDDAKIPVYAGRKANGMRLRIALPTLRQLERRGLATSYPAYLTPLGIEVRALLKDHNA